MRSARPIRRGSGPRRDTSPAVRSRRSTSSSSATGSTRAAGTTSRPHPCCPPTWWRPPPRSTGTPTSGSPVRRSTCTAGGWGFRRDDVHLRGARLVEARLAGSPRQGGGGVAPGDGLRAGRRRPGRQAHQADRRGAGRGCRDGAGSRDGDQGAVEPCDRGLRGPRGGGVVRRLPRVGVVTFPGSLDDSDARRALEAMGGEAVALWHAAHDLADVDAVVLPGGFSYGDYLRCGAIAARAPIMREVRGFAERGGPVLGICNGFQILCEAGLLPGALARNESLQFVCQDVLLSVENVDTPWTASVPFQRQLTIPIAHGDGRYFVDDPTLLSMRNNGQILFRYQNGNPNGSIDAIAGICNKRKNVMGMMPHPERASILGGGDGNWLWNRSRA